MYSIEVVNYGLGSAATSDRSPEQALESYKQLSQGLQFVPRMASVGFHDYTT